MRAKLIHRFLLIFFLAAIVSLSASDRDIALTYQDKILSIMDDDREKASELLISAFSYSRELSGLWMIKGLLYEEDDKLTDAEKAYREALEADDWEGADYDAYLYSYMTLLRRMNLWDRVSQVLPHLGYYRLNNREVLLAAGWADYFSGEWDNAFESASRGISLYSRDPRFFTLALATASAQNRKEDVDGLLDSYLYYWGDSEKVLHDTVRRLFKLGRLPQALKDHYQLSGNDSLAVYFNLTVKLNSRKSENSMNVIAVLENQLLDDIGLIRRLYDVCDERGRDYLNAYVLEGDRDFYMDSDGDGFPEAGLNRNKIIWTDRDRDGFIETRVALDDKGLPREWRSLKKEGGIQHISFYAWPYIMNVTFSDYREPGEKLFRFLYPRFSLAGEFWNNFLIRGGEDGSLIILVYSLLQGDIRIGLENFMGAAYRVEEMLGTGTRAVYLIHNGEILAMEEDNDGDQIYERQILMDSGEIRAARRDLDGDGQYDLFEYYEKGIWRGYAVNLNGKSWSEFYQDWSVIPLKLWDFDKDKLINAYIITLPETGEMIIRPQVGDLINSEDLLYWEKEFEAQWYR